MQLRPVDVRAADVPGRAGADAAGRRRRLTDRALLRFERLGPTVPALLDQAVVSGGSFLMTALIGRFLGANDLGIYILVVSGLMLAAAVQDATISTSFMTRRPDLDEPAQRAYAGGCFLLAAGFSALLGILAAGTRYATGGGEGPLAAAIAFLVPAFLLREYLRRYEFVYLRMGSALLIDGAAIGLQLLLLVAVLYAGYRSVPLVLATMLTGNAVAVAIGLVRRRHMLSLTTQRVAALLRDIAGLSGWVLLALLLFVAVLQSMPWLVAASLDIQAAGAFAAAAALANLGNPVLTGVINIMMPKAANVFARDGATAVLPAILRHVLVLAAATATITSVTVVLANEMLQLVFGSAFKEHALLVVTLSIAFFIRGLGAGAYVGCWALRRPAWNAAVNAAMLLVAVPTAWFSMPELGVLGAGLGLLAADLVATLARWVAFLKSCTAVDAMRGKRRPQGAARRFEEAPRDARPPAWRPMHLATALLIFLSLGTFRRREIWELFADGGVDWEVKGKILLWIGLGGIALCCWRRIWENSYLLLRAPLLFYFAFFALAALSTIYSGTPALTLFRAGQLGIVMALGIAVADRIERWPTLVMLFLGMNWALLLIGLTGYPESLNWRLLPGYQEASYIMFEDQMWRFGTPMGHFSQIGIAAAMALLALIARLRRAPTPGEGCVLFWLLLTVLLSVSRTAVGGWPSACCLSYSLVAGSRSRWSPWPRSSPSCSSFRRSDRRSRTSWSAVRARKNS